MTTLAIVLVCVIMVILNVVVLCKSAASSDLEHPGTQNSPKSQTAPIITTILAILTIAISLLNINIKVPTVLSLNGMLTEDYPEIVIKNDFLFASYYSENSHELPAEEGEKYKGPFIPEHSTTYYVQSRFLWNMSDVFTYTFTTYQDSLNKLGEQNGEPGEQDIGILTSDFSFTSVSNIHITDYHNPPSGFRSGWGDNSGGRSGCTIAEINEGKLYEQIIFNSITDSTIGDERNFVGAREDREIEEGEIQYWNADLIDVEIGKTYYIRLYGHNNSPKGYDRTAEDVKIQFQVPEETGRSIAVHGLISSSNAVPSLYWDGVVLTCETPFHLEFVDAKYENNGMGGVPLDSNVVNHWVPVGYDKFDGRIPGCYQYDFYAVIRVKIVEG